VHHRWGSDAELHSYLSEDWQHYVGFPGRLPGGRGMRRLVPGYRFPNPAGDDLPGAGPIATDPDAVVAELGADRCLLLFDRGMFAAAMPNPYLGAAIVRAINDWNLDRWLARDDGLHGAVLLPGHMPDEAAAEIRRVGAHPKIAAALFASNAIGPLAGHPIYHPIYAAAEELGLPVVFHRGLDALADVPAGTAGGGAGSFAEYMTMAPLALVSQVTSVLTHGVFARFPGLRVYLVGAGVSWLPGVLRRMELMMRSLRRELPWVRERPTDYFERHVRVSTYGIERHARPEALERLFDAHPDVSRMLCFASGYPSWDTTRADELAELLPDEWAPSVLAGNADEWFRWSS
jgi:uncharacterized protein